MNGPGFELADAFRDSDDVELVDFTRDGYQTMFVRADTHRAKETVAELASEYDFRTEMTDLDEETAAYRLRVLSPQKVRDGR